MKDFIRVVLGILTMTSIAAVSGFIGKFVFAMGNPAEQIGFGFLALIILVFLLFMARSIGCIFIQGCEW